MDDIFNSYSNFDRTICKQTVETLIRHRKLRRLILDCTVYLCPTKGTLGLYGLNNFNARTIEGGYASSIKLITIIPF